MQKVTLKQWRFSLPIIFSFSFCYASFSFRPKSTKQIQLSNMKGNRDLSRFLWTNHQLYSADLWLSKLVRSKKWIKRKNLPYWCKNSIFFREARINTWIKRSAQLQYNERYNILDRTRYEDDNFMKICRVLVYFTTLVLCLASNIFIEVTVRCYSRRFEWFALESNASKQNHCSSLIWMISNWEKIKMEVQYNLHSHIEESLCQSKEKEFGSFI